MTTRSISTLLLILLPLLLKSEFFMRTLPTSERLLRELGGSQIYHTPITVNGSEGSLKTFVFDQPSELIVSRIARKLKIKPPRSSGALLTATRGRLLSRYLVMRTPQSSAGTLVTVLEQNAEALQPGKSAPKWPDNIPVFNATPGFTAECHQTRTSFLSALSSCRTPPAAIDQAVNALTTGGWRETLPSSADFKLMTKKHRVCVVFAAEKSGSGDITINILQRAGSRE